MADSAALVKGPSSAPGAAVVPPSPDYGAWDVTEKKDLMDDVANVALSLQSDEPLELAFPYGGKYATLLIRCRQRQTSAYVVTQTPVESVYGELDETAVRYRLDEGRPQSARFTEATDHSAVFSPNPVAFARQLAGAKQLRFEFTPYDAAATTVSFTLAGLAAALPKVATACAWGTGRQGAAGRTPARALRPFAGQASAEFDVDTLGNVDLGSIKVLSGGAGAEDALRDTLDRTMYPRTHAPHHERATFTFRH